MEPVVPRVTEDNEKQGDDPPTLDPDFAADMQAIVERRKPRNPPDREQNSGVTPIR